MKLLKKPEYLRPLIIVSILRSFGSLNFFGTSFAFDVEGLGLGYNSMIAGFMEIISFFSLTVFIHKMPRRKGIAGFYFIVLLMGFLFLFDFVKENSLVATMIMSTSRIFSSNFFCNSSHFLHFDCFCANISIHSRNSVYCGWNNRGFWACWSYVWSIDCRFEWQDWYWLNCVNCDFVELCNLAEYFPEINP